MRSKIVWSVCPKDFEEKMDEQINTIESFGDEVKDIKYSTTVKNNVVVVYTALVMYGRK